MLFAVYYVIFLFVIALCWPYTLGLRRWARFPWIAIGIAIAVLPIFFPWKQVFYYGLLGDFTIFLWSSDTWMANEDRRPRSLIGGIVLAFVPAAWNWPIDSWSGVLLVPTVGHVVVSGSIWGLTLGRT